MAVAHNQRVHPSYATVKKNRVGETGGSGNGRIGWGRRVGLVGGDEGKKREGIKRRLKTQARGDLRMDR